MSKIYQRPFPGVKWLGHKAAHSPLSSVKVKNTWSYIPARLCLNGMQKENLPLTGEVKGMKLARMSSRMEDGIETQ